MARWTQKDYERLLRAYRSGARRVKYEDKEVEYRSKADMESSLREAEAELQGVDDRLSTRRTHGAYSKGFSQ